MIRVSPMPGEIAEGHLSRIRIVNGISSRKRLIDLLRAQSSDPSAPVLHLLAAFSGMDSTTYAIRHSMVPVLRVASREEAPALHGSPEGASYSRRLGMLAPTLGSRICARCIAQSLAEQGFSWFRREHQLLGVDICPIHGCGLQVIHGGDAFSETPEIREVRDELKSVQWDSVDKEGGDSFVGRFVSLSCSYLNRDAPLPARALHAELSRRARLAGLRTSDSGHRPLLSDAILERAPKGWLQAHFPMLVAKLPSKKYYPIDSLLMPSSPAGSGDAYALAIAALCVNEGDSRACLEAASQRAEIPKAKHRRLGPEFWQGKAYLLYEECSGNVTQMARLMGVDRKYLGAKLMELGLPGLGKIENSDLLLALKDFAGGAGIAESCLSRHVDQTALESLLRVVCGRLAKVASTID